MSSGRVFQTRGPATGKARLPTVESLTGGTSRRLVPAERNVRRVSTFNLQLSIGWLVEQGLTSHSTQFRSFRRRCFYRSDDPTNSVKALKEGGWLVIQIALNLTRLISPRYNNTTRTHIQDNDTKKSKHSE